MAALEDAIELHSLTPKNFDKMIDKGCARKNAFAKYYRDNFDPLT